MSKFTKIAVAATMAATLIGTSMSAAQAGKRGRNLALGAFGLLAGAAIISHHNRKHRSHGYAHKHNRHIRHCHTEYREVWSNYYDDYVQKRVKVCY